MPFVIQTIALFVPALLHQHREGRVSKGVN
jgi:hypothetical protein